MRKQIYDFKEREFLFNYTLLEQSPSIDVHLHDQYEIYYLLSGDVTYYIEGQSYKMAANDIIITNNLELHRPIFDSNQLYERMIIQFYPSYVSNFQDAEYNLLNCFEKRKLGYFNRIEASDVFQYGMNKFFDNIKSYCIHRVPESSIMIKVNFVELLVTLNQYYNAKKELNHSEHYQHDAKVLSILKYINEHLDEKITLDLLGRKFFINKYYLCHIFKKHTGFTIVEYITYKRIMKAKELLVTGMPVMEVASKVGFGDYSNFYKVFKKIVGTSPKKLI